MPPAIAQDRLVRKEVALGVVREIVPPETHIGLTLCPWLEVATDDVIFDYAKGLTDGLAPARSEDAESELAQKDDTFAGQGRASVIDWAVKDRYKPSDISRYREFLRIAELIRDTDSLPLTVTSATEDWAAKIARDTLRRRRKLDNRMEWMIMTPLGAGGMSYNDGRIKFTVDYGRPALQTSGGSNTFSAGNNSGAPVYWDDASGNGNPIADIIRVQEYMYDLYGVRITRAIVSRKILNSIMMSNKFTPYTGFTSGADPRYLIDGWGPQAAIDIVERQTGLKFIEYDSVYRTRPIGSNTVTNNRFTNEKKIIFLPDEADLAEFDDTPLGFGKTLTSPHPEGNWAAGFYEWERERVDPWGYDAGTGVKAFPVFPHMDKTGDMQVLT